MQSEYYEGLIERMRYMRRTPHISQDTSMLPVQPQPRAQVVLQEAGVVKQMTTNLIVKRCPTCNRNIYGEHKMAEETTTQQRTVAVNAMYAKDKKQLITPGHDVWEPHVCKEC